MKVECSVADKTFSHTFDAHASGPANASELARLLEQLANYPSLPTIHSPKQSINFGDTVTAKTFSDNPEAHCE